MLLPPWQNPEDAGKSWLEGDVTVENIPLPATLPGYFHLRITQRLVQRARQFQPDVIHFFKPKAYSGLAHWLSYHLPSRRRPRFIVKARHGLAPGGEGHDLEPAADPPPDG